MKYSFTIPGRMRGLNEYIDSCRRNAKGGGRMKRKEQDWVVFCIRSKLRGVHIKHPVIIHYHWYEPNQRRDKDNISSFGRKVIQDALVQIGILNDDGWKDISGFEDRFYVDRKNPRIVVELIEEEEG